MRKVSLFFLFLFSGVLFAACNPRDWRAKAGLQVETKVGTGAVQSSVLLDGKYLGKTPYANSDIKPANYTLEIRPDNPALVPYQTNISLKKGVLSFVLWKPGDRPETSGGVIYETESLKNPRESELSITTIPDGGIIRVDDQAKGFAPVLVEHITPGEHSYEVSLPSYEIQKNTINVLEGYRMNVTAKLARQVFDSPTPSASPTANLATASGILMATTSGKLQATTSASTSLPKPKVHILSTKFLQDGKEVLRVRPTPDAGARTIGFAPVGNEYPYLKETMDGWYKISFENKPGWVSSHYAQLME
jgi:hypothetical protein